MSQSFVAGIVFILLGVTTAVIDPFVTMGNAYAEGGGDVLNGLAAFALFAIGTVLVYRGLRQRPS
jgi:hypothetical protein